MASFIISTTDTVVASIATRILSGSVAIDGVPAIRRILIYKNKGTDLFVDTYSDVSGNFAVEVTGGGADQFRVVCVGEPGENSKVYEGVRLT